MVVPRAASENYTEASLHNYRPCNTDYLRHQHRSIGRGNQKILSSSTEEKVCGGKRIFWSAAVVPISTLHCKIK